MRKPKAPDNKLIGSDSSVPHGASPVRAPIRKAVVDPDYPGAVLAVDGDYAARARARVVDTTEGVKAEPAWAHAERDGVDGTKDNFFAIDAQGNPQWATEQEVDATKQEYEHRGAKYSRDLKERSIDARAFFDGRLPADWKVGDAVPENALALHPDSHYLSDFCSHQLCTCATRYFMFGTSLFVEITELQQAS